MWGYNGLVPGPTIRTVHGNAGKKIPAAWSCSRSTNSRPSTRRSATCPGPPPHLHGSPSKPQYDGYAGDLTSPGEWKNYQYPNNCTPRTLWYHDHGVHHTAENVYMGLAAQYHVVDEQLESSSASRGTTRTLPTAARRQYECPLILSDVMFTAERPAHVRRRRPVRRLRRRDPGQRGAVAEHEGRAAQVPVPRAQRFARARLPAQAEQQHAVQGDRHRRRLHAERRRTVTPFTIGMAERYEIIIDFKPASAGTKVQLLNDGVEERPGLRPHRQGHAVRGRHERHQHRRQHACPTDFGAGHSAMALKAADRRRPSASMRLHRSNSMWNINGTTWDDVVRSNYEHIFANPQPNAVEIWDVENSSGGWFHPLHIHLVDFQVLSRNGRPPRPGGEGPQGRRLRRRGRDRPPAHALRARGRAVHDPLPQPVARGPRHDDPVPGGSSRHRLRLDQHRPPKPLPAPELVPQQPATVQATDDTDSSTTEESTAATPTTTAAAPTTTTTGPGATGSTSSTTTPATTTATASPTTSAGPTSSSRRRGRSGR